MNRNTLLIFKFDGILINTVELYTKKVWQALSELDPALVDVGDEVEDAIDRLISLNWEKGSYRLAEAVCRYLGAESMLDPLRQKLKILSLNMASEYQLNQGLMRIIAKLHNADFPVALYSRRTFENFSNIADLVRLDKKYFNFILSADHFPGDHNNHFRSLSDWSRYMGMQATYFGNTKEDSAICGDGIKLVTIPEQKRRPEEIFQADFLQEYLSVFVN
ncbi:MAG: HAD hydrolase-like protein [Patescibacteria group bacterium]